MPPPPSQPLSASVEEASRTKTRTQVTEPEETAPQAFAPARALTRADRPVNVSTIMAIALPTLVEQMVTFGVRATDTYVAGHTVKEGAVNTAAAAAVGTMTYLQWFGYLTASAIGVGATAIIARSIGANRPRLANRVAGTACTASFLLSLAVAAIFFLVPRYIVRVFGLEGQAQDFATQYLQIMAFTVCLQSVTATGNACLRGAGDTLRPMITTVTLTALTVFLVPALSFGWFGLPVMGIKGNALGTLIAYAVAGVITLSFLLSGSAGIKLRKRHFRILPHMLARVFKIGLPSGMENLLLWGGQVLIVVVAARATDNAVGVSGVTLAAHQAVINIESLAFLPGMGFGIACATLVGQYLGAKKPAEATHAVVLCQRLAVLAMTIMAAPMVFIPHLLLPMLVSDAPPVAIGTIPLILAGLAQPGFAVQIVKSAALRGAGDTINPMIATVSGIFLRLVLVLSGVGILSHFGHARWGLTVVWSAIFIDLNYRGVFNTAVFRRGKWKTQKV